jgi:hypothetical protein
MGTDLKGSIDRVRSIGDPLCMTKYSSDTKNSDEDLTSCLTNVPSLKSFARIGITPSR